MEDFKFANWRLSVKSPIRQIKNLAKVSRYTVSIEVNSNIPVVAPKTDAIRSPATGGYKSK